VTAGVDVVDVVDSASGDAQVCGDVGSRFKAGGKTSEKSWE
jgi:hypothetical protein